MENAVEALKTAAAVLVFIIALTVAFTMFSKAKNTTDAIVTMQDKQEYLEAPEVDGGILYTSSDVVGDEEITGSVKSKVEGMTIHGDRIVGIDDVISTIYRYNVEKYGVTILQPDGTVLARFDSNTENIMRQWYNIQGVDTDGDEIIDISASQVKNNYKDKIQKNLTITHYLNSGASINIDLEDLYEIEVDGGTSLIRCGAPWYGNQEEILKRCNIDIKGGTYTLNNQVYQGKNLYNALIGKMIIEVVNEIDTSDYLEDPTDGKTNLLQQYQLPTTEIIYIIK